MHVCTSFIMSAPMWLIFVRFTILRKYCISVTKLDLNFHKLCTCLPDAKNAQKK